MTQPKKKGEFVPDATRNWKRSPRYMPVFDLARCTRCGVCAAACTWGEIRLVPERMENGKVLSAPVANRSSCGACHYCERQCPEEAITIVETPFASTHNYWRRDQENMWRQVDPNHPGHVLLVSTGADSDQISYFDHLMFDACQVTNPPIDPLREPIELRTYLGRRDFSAGTLWGSGGPSALPASGGRRAEDAGRYSAAGAGGACGSSAATAGREASGRAAAGREAGGRGDGGQGTHSSPTSLLKLETPILFSAMSFGSINLRVQIAEARAAAALGTLWNTGEGGLHRELYDYAKNTIVQVASGRFGVSPAFFEHCSAVEIKIGQGAKPGIGGHLPGEKVTGEISMTRMIPEGSDALSPAPHHDIYSIEDLRQLIYAIKETTEYRKPVSVKVSAVHNIAPIVSGIARAGADIIAIDGFRGGTGAAPRGIRQSMGIPIELAISAADKRLRDEKIRHTVSLIAAGGIRNSSDVLKAICLGADAVYLGTAVLVALGCGLCQRCYADKCSYGITTNREDLARRIDVDLATRALTGLISAWSEEIKELMGGMGINTIGSLVGNRDRLRGLHLTSEELGVLGVRQAGG